jgi:uncharacterized membrane protein (UPF0127 family)
MQLLIEFLKQHALAVAILVFVFASAITFSLVFIPLTAAPDFGSIDFEDDSRIIVEIANTPQKRTKGLGGRNEIQESFGMLFLFPEYKTYAFWMYGMKFPIDIIWIRDNTVVGFSEDVPVGGPLPLAKYAPDEPVNRVLEVRAGFVKRHAIDIGETLDISLQDK